MQSHSKEADWCRSTGGDPEFTDVEGIVSVLIQGYFCTNTLKRTYELVGPIAGRAVPIRTGYKQGVRRLHRLLDQLSRLARAAEIASLQLRAN